MRFCLKTKPREGHKSSGGCSATSIKRVFLGLVVLAIAGVPLVDQAGGADTDTDRFRIAFSSGMFTEVHPNDAKAAVKVWGQTIARERGIETDSDAAIFADFNEMSHALRTDRVDAVGMTVVEYEKLRSDTQLSPIYVTQSGGNAREQYLLLVHSESGIAGLGNLQGRSLIVSQNVRACLAQAWLDTLLIQKGFKAASEFMGSITPMKKPSQAVLPVFFRKSDACVIARSAFSTLCELNPQLEKKLKILESSPDVVPAVFAFRGGYASPVKDRLMDALRRLHETPAGQQVLTIFLADRLEEKPESFLQSAMDIIDRQRVLVNPSKRAVAAAASTAVKEKEPRTP